LTQIPKKIIEKFEHIFGSGKGKIRIFFAPGRVNLIGEHTDYNGGYVFPASLTYGTWAIVRLREDGVFRLASTYFDKKVTVQLDDMVYREEDGWANYPKGVISEFLKLRISLSGADILYHGNIPHGAGLSSSASIELVTGIALQTLNVVGMDRIEVVKLAQRAENQFVGVNCGIMDQFAVGMGKANHAILLKCDTLDYNYVPFDLQEYKLVITNSNKRRGLADSKYNERRKECEEGFAVIQKYLPDISSLGDVSEEIWQEVQKYINSQTIRHRLDHVITENARVVKSQKALERGDLEAFGKLMIQSHESLRDCYEVTGPELDSLFEEVKQVEGCIGTRMTGAGFGGCTVSIVRSDRVSNFKEQVKEGYLAKTGLTPTFYICDIGDGAREVTKEVEACLS
jgi:galactokinase